MRAGLKELRRPTVDKRIKRSQTVTKQQQGYPTPKS